MFQHLDKRTRRGRGLIRRITPTCQWELQCSFSEVGRANWQHQGAATAFLKSLAMDPPRAETHPLYGMAIFANGKESWEENFKRIAAPARRSCRTKQRRQILDATQRRTTLKAGQTTAQSEGADQTPCARAGSNAKAKAMAKAVALGRDLDSTSDLGEARCPRMWL